MWISPSAIPPAWGRDCFGVRGVLRRDGARFYAVEAMTTTPLPDVDLATLRAWADAGVISTARYVEEVERRRREQALAAQAVAFEALGEDSEPRT